MSKNHKLVWIPLAGADNTKIPYTIIEDSGKLVYKLNAKLTFGHLEFDGHPITGYFDPQDDTESIIRPWMFTEDTTPEEEASDDG